MNQERTEFPMKAGNAWQPVLSALTLLLFAEGAAKGQLPPDPPATRETFALLQLNFINPGARSLGVGGAFIALADDATAAFSNPAGLTALTRPEISLEGKGIGFTHSFLKGGRAFGASSLPSDTGIDGEAGLIEGQAKDSTRSLAFLSGVYATGDFAFAIYRREAANFSANVETEGAFVEDLRLFPIRANLNVDIVDVGISAAVKAGGGVSLGMGFSIYEFAITALTNRFGFRTFGTATGDFYGPPLFDESNVNNRDAEQGDDTDTGINLGVLWHHNGRWSFGAVYRQGPSFQMSVENLPGPAAKGHEPVRYGESQFKVPDVFGVGFAFRPRNHVKISVDYDRVQYSQLAKGLLQGAGPEEDLNYVIDDGNELHIGFEYLFVQMRYPLALRFGLWLDPDHQLRYTGDQPVKRALLPGGTDQFHFSAGVGTSFGERLSLDGAFDYSKRVASSSISLVLRF